MDEGYQGRIAKMQELDDGRVFSSIEKALLALQAVVWTQVLEETLAGQTPEIAGPLTKLASHGNVQLAEKAAAFWTRCSQQ